jgi:hypothetical protein
MAMLVHPRVQTRNPEPRAPLVRVLVHAPSPTRAAWIEAELAHRSIIIQIGFSVSHVISALVEDPPPRPQILIADFDDLEAGAVMDLHVLREQGWFGRIIGLGHVPPTLRTSLVVERVIEAPFTRGALHHVITVDTTGSLATTARLPVL